jgi:PTS system nitrogen regulatory IIA component
MADRRIRMSVLHCFEQGTVISDLQSTDKFEALREVIRRAPVFKEIGNLDALENAVVARERLQSTGFGHGVAVAHGRAAGVERVLIAMGLSRAGIPFESPDSEPVRLLFVIASPLIVSLDYLHALSTLVRCLRHQALRERLLAAASADEIQMLLRQALMTGAERCDDPLTDPQACGAAG